MYIFCQLTNKQVHCTPDKDCMERERSPACSFQSPPCLDLHHRNYVQAIHQASPANASHRDSNAYQITANVPLPMNVPKIAQLSVLIFVLPTRTQMSDMHVSTPILKRDSSKPYSPPIGNLLGGRQDNLAPPVTYILP